MGRIVKLKMESPALLSAEALCEQIREEIFTITKHTFTHTLCTKNIKHIKHTRTCISKPPFEFERAFLPQVAEDAVSLIVALYVRDVVQEGAGGPVEDTPNRNVGSERIQLILPEERFHLRDAPISHTRKRVSLSFAH
jgi:hypothetical protein